MMIVYRIQDSQELVTDRPPQLLLSADVALAGSGSCLSHVSIRCFLPAAVIVADQAYRVICVQLYTLSASTNQPSRLPSTRFPTRED
jgi:hypothetical protein